MSHSDDHIMLSYQWKHQKLVKDIYAYLLLKQKWPVWMDVEGGMGGSLTESMASGVQNCCVLVCFMTPEYQESANCKKELTYAMQCKKPIIPCLLGCDEEEGWKPSDWLGLTIADLLYINFTGVTKENFESKCNELILKIHSLAGTSPNESEPAASSIAGAANDDEDEHEDEEEEEDDDDE